MRIRLEHSGTVFEFERHPLPAGRFRAICALVAAGVYASMVVAVTALCGGFGLLLALVGTMLVLMVGKGMD